MSSIATALVTHDSFANIAWLHGICINSILQATSPRTCSCRAASTTFTATIAAAEQVKERERFPFTSTGVLLNVLKPEDAIDAAASGVVPEADAELSLSKAVRPCIEDKNGYVIDAPMIGDSNVNLEHQRLLKHHTLCQLYTRLLQQQLLTNEHLSHTSQFH